MYVVLWGAGLPQDKLCDFLMAYFCFYHLGTASWVVAHGPSTTVGYWRAMLAAASTSEHPRSSERRHFRGQAAIKAVESLMNSCSEARMSCQDVLGRIAWGTTPAGVLAHAQGKPGPMLVDVVTRVKELRNFGDWIAFKVADILERLAIAPVQFSPVDVLNMYEAPRKGAEAMAERHGPAKGNIYFWAYNQLIRRLGHLMAPPRYERRINIQEIETILCKWKSHLNGHYTIGKDIAEVKHALEKYEPNCAIAARLLGAGKTGGLW